MSKNGLILIVSALFLVASILFSISQKRSFSNSLNNINSEYKQVEHIADLKRLWSAKGVKSKLNKIANLVSANKKKSFLVKRSKADMVFDSLNERELNKIISKLAMLPLQFKKLLVIRSGNNFKLECTCVW